MIRLLTSTAAATLFIPLVAFAQTSPPAEQRERTPTTQQRTSEEFLLAKPVMDLLLRQWTQEVATQFNFDARQRDKATTEVIRRWGLFFAENRTSIQPLLLEYMKLRLSPDPPDSETLRAWAHRTSTLLARLRNHVEHGVAAIREIFKPHQRALFERQVQTFRTGMSETQSRLTRLEKGEFNRDDFQDLFEPPTQRFGQGRGSRTTARRRVEHEEPQNRVEIEIGAWRTYVADFMRTHRFDPGQRNAAISVLSEMTLRAAAHRAAKRKEIGELERSIGSFGGSVTEQAELKKQLAKLYGPFDAMFQELQSRLYEILTTQQRARIPKTDDDENTPKP